MAVLEHQQQESATKKKGRGRPKKQEQQQEGQQPPAHEQGNEEGEGNEEDGGVLCGPGCINRSLHVECTAATCRFAQAGRCRNQRIAKREVRLFLLVHVPVRASRRVLVLISSSPTTRQRPQGKGFEVFRTDCRGWGVRAAEDIRPGSYIMEYVGEVRPLDFG